MVDLDPQGDLVDDNLTPIGELKKVQISVEDFQVTHIGSRLSQEEEEDIIKLLRDKSRCLDMEVIIYAWDRPSVPSSFT